MRQVIIARKDLNMSPGKLAAQVAHASICFLTRTIKAKSFANYNCKMLPCVEFDIDENHQPIQTYKMYRHPQLNELSKQAFEEGKKMFCYKPVGDGFDVEKCEPEVKNYTTYFSIDKETYENWICGSFTKTVCQAKNKNQLMKAVTMAEELGLEEGVDFFLIKDNCLTELEPEETDENGTGRTLTCIGFRPLPDEIAHAISKKYHLYI